MSRRMGSGLGGAIGWLVFPVVPVVLESVHYDVVNLSFDGHGGPDPYDWTWFKWVTLLGPLIGYGFLAGATLGLPDDPAARGWRARRAVWVALGPWAGLLAWGVLVLAIRLADAIASQFDNVPAPNLGHIAVSESVKAVAWVVAVSFGVVTLCYSWLLPTVAVVKRARRQGRLRAALERGLGMMIAFVGSLLAAFWAIIQSWRSYFFDTTVMPILLAALILAALSGCGAPVTQGEVRRRELFQALLVSWVFGLAILWRWWSRRRPKP